MTEDSQSILSVILHMMGAISLLLWGSYTVRTSMERALGARLNQLLSTLSRSKLKAVVGGAVVAMTMQSATAAILLATELLGAGTISLVTAMVIVLGADLGSAIATRILFLDLSLLPPALLAIGMILYRSANTWRIKYFGRIVIGLGLMLLSIQLMKQITVPLANSSLPTEWVLILEALPWLSMIFIAIVTWFFHSSVAIVLVIASLSQTGVIDAELFVPMLLGVNIGAGLIALPMVARSTVEAKSAVITNILIRTVLALGLFFSSALWIHLLPSLASEPGAQVIMLHIAFNAMLLVLFIPFIPIIVSKTLVWMQSRVTKALGPLSTDVGSGLDPSLLEKPELAISCARREAYRLGDITETLFSRALEMFQAEDQSEIERFIEIDREINARNRAIHQYLSEARRHVADQSDEKALDKILHFASTMENIGDTISHNLSRLAGKRLGRGVAFSPEGLDEITNIHNEVLSLLDTEINSFASNQSTKPKKTRKMISYIRQLCNESIARHRRRLSDHKLSSMGSSSIHQDAVRDLLQIALLLEHTPAVD